MITSVEDTINNIIGNSLCEDNLSLKQHPSRNNNSNSSKKGKLYHDSVLDKKTRAILKYNKHLNSAPSGKVYDVSSGLDHVKDRVPTYSIGLKRPNDVLKDGGSAL